MKQLFIKSLIGLFAGVSTLTAGAAVTKIATGKIPDLSMMSALVSAERQEQIVPRVSAATEQSLKSESELTAPETPAAQEALIADKVAKSPSDSVAGSDGVVVGPTSASDVAEISTANVVAVSAPPVITYVATSSSPRATAAPTASVPTSSQHYSIQGVSGGDGGGDDSRAVTNSGGGSVRSSRNESDDQGDDD
jgi:hypothetical protein